MQETFTLCVWLRQIISGCAAELSIELCPRCGEATFGKGGKGELVWLKPAKSYAAEEEEKRRARSEPRLILEFDPRKRGATFECLPATSKTFCRVD